MGDIGEMYKSTKDIRKEDSTKRKQSNRLSSALMLSKNNIKYEIKNDGLHLVIRQNGMIADFWPSTGKFNIRGHKRYFRGVRLLIKIVRGDYSDSDLKSIVSE